MAKRGNEARPPTSGGAGRGADQWSYLSALSVAPLRPANGTWLVTFTDLVGLLLAFFVLMFSMTKMDEARWQGLIRSLASALDSVRAEAVSRPSVDYQLPTPVSEIGTNLAYLAPVVLEQLAAEPALARAVIRRLPDRIVISLSAEALFAPSSARLTEQGAAVAFAIGGIVRNIRNVLTVEAVGSPAAAGKNSWSQTLARAAILAEELRAAGYGGGIAAVGHGAGGGDAVEGELEPERRAAFDARIDFVIHERARDD